MRIAMDRATGQAETPAQQFARSYAGDLRSLTGMIGVTTSSAAPDHVRLHFQTRELAALADAALRDVVLGARLVFVDPGGRAFDSGSDLPAWATDPANVARQVAALPGVVAFREYRGRAFGFTVDSAATRAALDLLVDPTLGGRATSFWELAAR
jgi:hypothetical protein